MVSVPTPRTWYDGDLVGPEDLNLELRDNMNFAVSPPMGILRLFGGDQSIASGAETRIQLDNILHDSHDGAQNLGTSTAGWAAPVTGLYEVSAVVTFGPFSGDIRTNLYLNNNRVTWQFDTSGGSFKTTYCKDVLRVYQGDVVGLGVRPMSDSVTARSSDGAYVTQMSVKWVAP